MRNKGYISTIALLALVMASCSADISRSAELIQTGQAFQRAMAVDSGKELQANVLQKELDKRDVEPSSFSNLLDKVVEIPVASEQLCSKSWREMSLVKRCARSEYSALLQTVQVQLNALDLPTNRPGPIS